MSERNKLHCCLFIIAFNKYLNLTTAMCDSTSNYCGFVIEVTEERPSVRCHCKSSDVARHVTLISVTCDCLTGCLRLQLVLAEGRQILVHNELINLRTETDQA
jgi:hypothetical protein